MNSRSSSNRIEAKKLILLAIPAIIAQLAQAGLGMIDVIMAGHHSAEALAAIAIATSIFNPVLVLVTGIILIINPMVAQYNGQQNWHQLREVFHNGLFLGLLLVVPSILLLTNVEPLLLYIGADATLIPITQGYLNALCWGVPGLYLFFALRFTNEGLFGNKYIMYITLSTLPLNVLLDYWFIYGGFGLAPMGAVGVGWATTIVYGYMFCLLLLVTAKSKHYRHIGLFVKWHKPNWSTLKNILCLGIPMGLTISLEVALFAVIGLMVSSYSISEIAGHQAALNIATMGYMLAFGLSTAITARVGFHVGRGQPRHARSVGNLGIGLTMLCMMCSMTALIVFPQWFAGLFSNNQTVIDIIVNLLFFAAMFQLSDGIQTASNAALRGFKDTKVALYISGFSYWVIGFPVSYYFAEVLAHGLKGYWYGLIVGLSVSALLVTLRFIYITNNPLSLKNLMLSNKRHLG